MEFLKLQLQIRYADWPYILQGFLAFFFLSLLGYIFLDNGTFAYFLLTISLLFIVLTAVHFNNLRAEQIRNYQYKIQALNELTKLIPLRAPLPAMSGWAATPELAIQVFKTIQAEKPKIIAELGSGVTTVVSAYALEKFNPEGKILSFDHESNFASKTKRELELHQLQDYVQLHTTPLIKRTLNSGNFKWYDIDTGEIHQNIDLLIIDGPPLETVKNARYPALPVLYSNLSDHATIIMHDTNRNNEAKTIKRWLTEYPDLECNSLSTEKGITIFWRKPSG